MDKGIYFSIEQYANFTQRTLCLIIDLLFISLLLYFVILILEFFPEINFIYTFTILIWFVFSILYFSVIKSSKFQTLGYKILGIKIVDLKGNKPSNLKMLFRFLISIFGPFELPHDILWLIDDSNRQSLRDKFAGTYVIKKNAVPIGTNTIVGKYYFINGFSFFFEEVSRDE